MIVFLEGTVHSTGAAYVDLNVRGVGYRVFAPENLTAQLGPGQSLFLHTHHHVREDADELYGFGTAEEKDWFELLLGVSGIGPKSALQMVAATDFSSFLGAIQLEDTTSLCQLPGVGKKTAQRMILELKDKLKSFSRADVSFSSAMVGVGGPSLTPYRQLSRDVIEALQTLGYNEKQAEQAAIAVLNRDAAPVVLEQAIKQCLQWLSPQAKSGGF